MALARLGVRLFSLSVVHCEAKYVCDVTVPWPRKVRLCESVPLGDGKHGGVNAACHWGRDDRRCPRLGITWLYISSLRRIAWQNCACEFAARRGSPVGKGNMLLLGSGIMGGARVSRGVTSL